MKYVFLTALFIFAKHGYCQDLTGVTIDTLPELSFNNFNFEWGYHSSGRLDTVAAILLVTGCDDCPAKQVSAFVVRKQFSYSGDRMPTYPPTSYDDYWTVTGYLDKSKLPFPQTTTVWDSKLKE